MMNSPDTIVAIATPPGRGGIGVIRISGQLARAIALEVLGFQPKPRYAHFAQFRDPDGQVLDEGIAIFFPSPASFTGEDILEFQGHGGPVILDILLQRLLSLGPRIAHPGEFSERAFLNDKIDLAQAEAIADLIDSASQQAAKSAVRSLQGEFSKLIHGLVEALTKLRMHIEAAIDFPEDEIDAPADGTIEQQLRAIESQLQHVLQQANQGAMLREGMRVVLAGKPNSGKSSLLNQLSGRESAIVTVHEGTTRDPLREFIHLDGMPLHLVDTAGLRISSDEVEQEGIRRAWVEIERADRVLLLVDASHSTQIEPAAIFPEFVQQLSSLANITVIRNKIDLTGDAHGEQISGGSCPVVSLSAKTGKGVQALRRQLKACIVFNPDQEGRFIARRRHLSALESAERHLSDGKHQLLHNGAIELLAEELRLSQQSLSEITGEFSSDDLLGRIFADFCIGK
jgi:tRNA modification GTPase